MATLGSFQSDFCSLRESRGLEKGGVILPRDPTLPASVLRKHKEKELP